MQKITNFISKFMKQNKFFKEVRQNDKLNLFTKLGVEL